MKSRGFTKFFFILCSVMLLLISAAPVYAVHYTAPPKSNILMHVASASIQINNVAAPDQTEVGVFNAANVLIGTQVVKGGILPDMTINGFNNQVPGIPGAGAGEALTIKVWDAVAQKEYSGNEVILASPASGAGPYMPATLPLTYTTNAFVLININTQSIINVSANSLSFGSVQVGSSANDQTVTVTNNNNADLSITDIGTANPLAAPFSITGGTCGTAFPITIGAAASCTITVHFAPTTTDGSPFTGSFNITSNDPANPVITVSVSGSVASVPAPSIAVAPNPVSFTSIQTGSANDQTVTVTNSGNADLSISAIATTNPLTAPFSITGGTCGTSATLVGGSSCTITVHFAPTTVAGSPFTGSFNITSNDGVNPVTTVNVSGTATSNAAPQVTLLTSTFPGNDNTVKFWQLSTTQTATAHVEVKNSGTADLMIGSINWVTPPSANPFSLMNDKCSSQTISAGNSCVLDVVFTPTATGSFSIALGIPSNDPASPATVTVSGNAVAPGTPPPAPVRNYPADGDTTVPTTFNFQWHKSLASGTISYEVCYWVDGDQSNTLQCTQPVTITASLQKKGAMFAGEAGASMLFFGIAFAGVIGNRKKLLMIIGLLVLTSLFVSSCGGGNKVATPSDLVNSTTVSLQAHTNYKWVVNASGDGGTTMSDEGHFTTAQ